MMYGTAFDTLTERRPRVGPPSALSGLGTLINSPFGGGVKDADLTLGITQAGISFITMDGKTFTDMSTLPDYLSANGNANSGAPASFAVQIVNSELTNALRTQFTDQRIAGSDKNVLLKQLPISALIGVLRQDYPVLPFYAYTPPPPPPPPASLPPVLPAGTQGQGVTITRDFRNEGFDRADAPRAGTTVQIPPLTLSTDWFWTWADPVYTLFNPALNLTIVFNTATGLQSGWTPQTAPAPVVAYPVPPGYTVYTRASGALSVWPVYGLPPTFDGGVASFAGSTAFYKTDGLSDPGYPSLGLDTNKINTGLYAVKTTDLGQIHSAGARTYELSAVEIFDLAAQKWVMVVFQTTEGGGSGEFITDPVALVSRAIADVYTFGQYEALRAGAQKVGVSDQTINLATEAFAALNVLIASIGAGYALMAPTAAVDVGAAGAEGSVVAGATETAATETVAASAVAETATAGTAVTAAGTSLLPASVISATTGLVGGAVKALAVSAIASEIKKLTGQTQTVPSYALVAPTPNATVPAPAPSGGLSPTLLALGAGALFLFTKRNG